MIKTKTTRQQDNMVNGQMVPIFRHSDVPTSRPRRPRARPPPRRGFAACPKMSNDVLLSHPKEIPLGLGLGWIRSGSGSGDRKMVAVPPAGPPGRRGAGGYGSPMIYLLCWMVGCWMSQEDDR